MDQTSSLARGPDHSPAACSALRLLKSLAMKGLSESPVAVWPLACGSEEPKVGWHGAVSRRPSKQHIPKQAVEATYHLLGPHALAPSAIGPSVNPYLAPHALPRQKKSVRCVRFTVTVSGLTTRERWRIPSQLAEQALQELHLNSSKSRFRNAWRRSSEPGSESSQSTGLHQGLQ